MSTSGLTRQTVAASPRDLDHAGVAAVDALLADRLAAHAGVLLEVDASAQALVDSLGQVVVGGKRLRAAFCLWGARAAGGTTEVAGATEAAAALELFHLAALVHDDLMDHSAVRRGRPTIHQHFTRRHRTGGGLGDSDDFGTAVAVLVGDLCLTWADDLLADAATLSARGREVRAVWSQMRDHVLAGQYLDVLSQTRSKASVDEVRRVLRYKSAKYTVEHPLLIGATLAGGSPRLLDGLASFGLQVGEAFQLRDDVLGVFGQPEVTGKPAIDDVREGKRTLLVAWAEANASFAQRRVLRRCLGDPGLGEDGLERVRTVLRDTGALADVEQRIERLAAEALETVTALPVDEESRSALTSLIETCAWRHA